MLDETILGTSDCIEGSTDIGFYCPSTTLTLNPLTLTGANGTSTEVTLTIANAESLFASGNAAFSNLAGASCEGGSAAGCNASTDYIDLGLPFFFGQANGIFVGISEGATYPNGFWAF